MYWFEKCPRKKNCEPISNIRSDCKTTYICGGLNGREDRDKFRFCFVTTGDVDCHDYDHVDLVDMVAVMSELLAIGTRRLGEK